MYDTLNGENATKTDGSDATGAEPIRDATNEIVKDLQSSGGTAASSYNYIAAGNIPAGGEDVGASIFGGKFTGGSWTPTNDVQGGPQPHDDNGAGNGAGSPAGHAAYAELSVSPGSGDYSAMGDLPEHTKLAITYNGQTVIAEKLDVGAGGAPVNGKPRVIDLWWETAKLLDPQGTSTLAGGTDVVNIRAVDPSTPTTPVTGEPAAMAGSPSCACPTTGSGPLTGNTPAEQAFNYYVQQKGLPAIAAAGLVGNFMSESGGDTENLDPTITNGIGAHGIAQWYQGRLANLVSFAASNHEQEDSLQTQLDFSWQELTGSYASVLSNIKKATSPSQAADIVNSDGPPGYSGGYESSGVAPTQREANAIKVFGEYGSGAPVAPVGGSPGPTSCPTTPAAAGVGTYQNPFRDITNLGTSRVDQGVDYTGSGNVYAIGDGTVVNTTNSGWPGGTFIVYKLSDGPAAGKYVYFGENCDNIKVNIGDTVTSSSVLCTMVDASPHIETGWADGTRIGDAAAHDVWVGYDSDSYYTAYGENFSQLLQKLGAPPGIIYPGATELGSLPGGWPTW